MNTYQLTAHVTGPLFLFASNKISYAEFLYLPEIVNHAHAIFGPVADVYLSYAFARKFSAGIAIMQFGSHQLFTILNAAHRTMVRFVLTGCIAAHTIVLHTLIR